MLRELIFEGADYQAISLVGRMPLLDLIAQCVEHNLVSVEESPSSLLANWVEELHNCGVDIEQYGRTELKLFQQRSVFLYFLPWEGSPDPSPLRLATFAYGSQPSQWRITLAKCRYPQSDEPERSIPGGWVEENDSLPNNSVSDEFLSADCME